MILKRKKALFIVFLSICMTFVYTLSIVDIQSFILNPEARIKLAFTELLEKPGIKFSTNQSVNALAGAFSHSNALRAIELYDMSVNGTMIVYPKEGTFNYEVKIFSNNDVALLDFYGFSDTDKVYCYEENVLKQKYYVPKEDLLNVEKLDRSTLIASFNAMIKTAEKVGNGNYTMTAKVDNQRIRIELTVNTDTQIEEIKLHFDDNLTIAVKVEIVEGKLRKFDVQDARFFDLKTWAVNVMS